MPVKNSINNQSTGFTVNQPASGVALNVVGGGQTVIGNIDLNITGTANTNINSTSNSGTISIGNTSSGAVNIGCGTAGISVGTTANAHTSTFGSTNTTSATTVQSGTGALNVTSTNGALTINSGTGTLALSNDASNTTVGLATGAAVKSVTLGSTNTTSATTVQSGTGALNVTSTNGALTINSGTGTLGLSNDASNTTVNLATGAAVKTVTLGSTNTTSSLVLRSGTGNIVANTGLTVDSIGRMTNTAQPCFVAHVALTVNNVTGNGTGYVPIFNTERVDQGNNYNNATGYFTAPRTGTYFFSTEIYYGDVAAGQVLGLIGFNVNGVNIQQGLFGPLVNVGYGCCQSKLIWNLTAGDTVNVIFIIYLGAGLNIDIVGGTVSNFGGILLC